ncbi:fibronectin type III domain-containing protein, partial [Nocardioides sp.]|uniref:fibronectin type III domain-containing protein n=1 Tax=Nocardioides sp. TaxID=35761 RepID=UPI0027345DE8
WRPPTSDGGAAVSGYRITAHRVNRAGTVVARLTRKAPASERARELRLRQGRYRFRVVAVNSAGRSQPSAWSRTVRAR